MSNRESKVTAEVVVMNSAGVALAADSAVMIGNEKIYNSALKVFALSKAEPVGIMVYGNAALMNVPWETIIKIFRKELSTTSYDTLPEYSDSFFSFLASRTDLFPTEAQESWLASNVSKYYRSILQDLTSRVDKHIYDTGEMNVSTTKEYMKEIIDEHHMHLANRSFLDGLDKKFEDELRKKYSIKIRAIREDMFKELPISRQVATKLDAIAAMICSKDIFSQSKSGVVIAGFGNKDIYPSVETNVIEGVICGRVKKKRLSAKSTRIQKGTECAVIAFAQADMVAAFMNGINPSIRDFVTSCLGKVFNRLPDLINQEALLGNQDVKDEVLKQYGADIQELLKQFFDQLKSHIQDEHVQPILHMVNALPKDELAAMAEALVNLTAFKRRLTGTLETVGGPIDVAVISKGDGLVWVKRKHYFPKELNPHFFTNYRET